MAADGMGDRFAPLNGAAPPNATGDGWAPVLPAPLPLPERIRHRAHGEPAAVWLYRDGDGAPLFAACRFDKPAGGKEVLPYICGVDRWRWGAPPAPRPLYGLDRLAARPAAPVLVVEGEKAADAAAALFPDWAAVSWQGGTNAVGKADWAALRGRSVAVWPDADAPGRKAAADVVKAATTAGAARAAVVAVPADWPDGWDVADPLPSGVAADALGAMLAGAVAGAAPEPDLRVLRMHRRAPPPLPLAVFGAEWQRWIEDAAEAAATAPDYVAAPLLAAASATIGNARWAQAHPGWREPPHLWMCSVGDSGGGKSPGADAILRDVLPRIEEAMCRDFPEERREWEAAVERAKERRGAWQKEVAAAAKGGHAAPLPPADSEEPPEPQPPCLRLNDTSIERVALMLAGGSPKGLLMVRDELAGHLLGMNNYNAGGRAFWLEAYGGRPYRVHRVKLSTPIAVPHMAVAWWGGTQPGRLAELMRGADDGLLARFCWVWPDKRPFDLPRAAPDVPFAVAAFDKLRLLEMQDTGTGTGPAPVTVPLAAEALGDLRDFYRETQERQQWAGGLMNSALGKMPGLALRLSLVLEYLWWAGRPGMDPPPAAISREAFAAAATLVVDYLLPMAERTYGDAAAPARDRDAATLARWIAKARPEEVHVRTLQRDVRLPGLTTAEAIHAASAALVEAGWLSPPAGSDGQAGRPKAAYRVNPALWGALAT